MSLDLDLTENAIFNFVFNFIDDSNFKMLRLDTRNLNRTPNALLYNKQKFGWYIVAKADQEQPPEGIINLAVKIDASRKNFLFQVNGDNYKFFKNNREVDLFQEYKEGCNIGWFNENGPVKLSNILIA